MDTELLKTFLAVEKSKHFGRAAEKLYLTPAAISARIRQLETVVGTPLFTRHRNNVTLTEAGERLKPYAENILESWSKALQDSSHSGGHGDQLAIGGTPNVWDCVLQGYLDQVHVARPELALRAECHGSEFLTAQLQGRQLDMAILFDPLKLDGLEREQIGEVSLQLVSAAKGLDLVAAMAGPYVQVDWGIRFGMQHTRTLPRHTRPALFTSTGRIGLDFVLRHGGSLYLPETTAAPYIKARQLYPVSGAVTITQTIHASYLKDSVKRPLVKQLTRLLKVGV